jgi:WD40 repeat protein
MPEPVGWAPSRTVEPLHAARWPSSIHALRWSPDGRWLAVGCRDGSIGLTAAAAASLRNGTNVNCST